VYVSAENVLVGSFHLFEQCDYLLTCHANRDCG